MKCAFLTLCLSLAIILNVVAHAQPPITSYVQFSETVCVAQVTSINKDEITFTIREVIKGKPPVFLILRAAPEVPVKIALNSEWLLASTGAKENTVGWAMDGDYGWVNAPIQRIDGQIHLAGNYGYVDPKLAADVSKGLTLEQLKDLAMTPRSKN